MKQTHVSELKKQEVNNIMHLIKEYPSFGIIDITNLPSNKLQTIRHKIKKDILIRTSKKRLIKIALNNSKDHVKNSEKLLPVLDNVMPALVFTTLNPFRLANLLNKNKSSAPARPGQLAPKDIIVLAGPTNFTPGPIIGELGAVGIKTMIQEGKIAVKEDSIIAHEGQEISQKASEIMAKLGIEPMEIGINLVAMYEHGNIYMKDVLSVTEEMYVEMIKEAYQNTFNLAVYISYMAKDTIMPMIKKAYISSKSVALKTNLEFSEEITKNQAADTEPKTEQSELSEEDKGLVGYTEEAVEKAQNILKELQDQKMRENRT